MRAIAQKQGLRTGRVIKHADKKIVGVNLNYFSDNHILYEDGSYSISSCLNCINHPCMYFTSEEINPEIIQGQTHNPDSHLCPTNAISLDITSGFPFVEKTKCIGCGICVKRCPVGAIFIKDDESAYINDIETDLLGTSGKIDELESTIHFFTTIPKIRRFSEIPKDLVFSFCSKVESLVRNNPYFENILARCLFACLGIPPIIKVNGDTNFRIDMLLDYSGNVCVVEVDYSLALLETPRSLLDGIAVINSRYGIPMEKVFGLVVCLAFPNVRSDYYEVITDIRNVLGIEIKTISIGCLTLLNYYKDVIDGNELFREKFFVNKDNTEVLTDITSVIPEIGGLDYLMGNKFFAAVK